MKEKSHRNAAQTYDYSSVHHGKWGFKTPYTRPRHSYFNKMNIHYHGHKTPSKLYF